MTLSYWWMHWFWITARIYLAISQDTLLTTHSILLDRKTPANASDSSGRRAAKAIGVFNANPPNNSYSPSNSSVNVPSQNVSSAVKIQKPSSKKIQFIYSNMTTRVTTNQPQFLNKEPTVINQNTTNLDLNITDNQMLIINTSLSAISQPYNLTYMGNDTNFNQTLISTDKMDRDEVASGNLSAAGITGITLGCVIMVGVICGVSYFLYRNRGFNRPQVLNDRCSNPDSSGYIDDASVRDNSEEMYSLDNDSFLNSLEAMTIQNYWTDTVKHTKL